MQRAVDDVRPPPDRARRRGAWQSSHASAGGAGPVLADDDVERVGGDKILREIRRGVGDAGGERRGDRRMRQIGRDQLLEFGDELVRALRRKIEPEQLDRDETILFRLIRAKHGTERARADLMKNAKWTESVRRRRAGSVRVQ